MYVPYNKTNKITKAIYSPYLVQIVQLGNLLFDISINLFRDVSYKK